MKIVLTGGGTAGHCLPHLAVLPYLKQKFERVDYIGSYHGIERDIVERIEIPYHAVTTAKLRRSITPSNLLIPVRLLKGIAESKRVLGELQPDVVFSKGGYVALPVVIAAKSLKIPVVAHESDLTVGLANKLSSRYASRMLTSFPETATSLPRAVYTGAPVREELLNGNRELARKKYGLTGRRPVLLVVGGSSGAQALNTALRQILPELTEKFQVLHLTGKGNVDESLRRKGYAQVEYEPDMASAYAAADIAVSRAGAGAVFELLACRIPSLLIPLPRTASRGDQILNAEYFSRRGLTMTLLQENLTKQALLRAIERLYREKSTYLSAMTRSPVQLGNADICREILWTAERGKRG